MSKDLVIPDYLKALIDSGDVQDDASNLVGSVSSVPRISLKGQKFRLIVDGEEKEIIKDSMHVVILGSQPDMPRLMAKTYYEGDYNPNDSGPPDCSSSDGISPDDWIVSPVSEKCHNCPKNKWGSAISKLSGKKAKACRDSKRLFIVKPTEITDGTIYTVNVTVSSLKALSEYGKFLSEHKLPMSAVITTLTLADDSDFPRLEFKMAGIMKEANGRAAITRSQQKEWTEYQGKMLEHDDADSKPSLTAPDNVDPTAPINADGSIEGSTTESTKSGPSDIDDILDQW